MRRTDRVIGSVGRNGQVKHVRSVDGRANINARQRWQTVVGR